ncbi:unnamed protein product [Candida verbasci]|uniref:ethanolamine kinase n=1 Tax=Candida verbasci TaxID=1227364 RepID=A0A9W4TXD6_9ASCO|nr:unnamed protein product [Candida verbasci]
MHPQNGHDKFEDAFNIASYCFVSNNKVHFIPIDKQKLLQYSKAPITPPSSSDNTNFLPDKLYLKNKNLLYELNNPSASEMDNDNSSDEDSDFEQPDGTAAIYFKTLIINLQDEIINDFTGLKNLLCLIFKSWEYNQIQLTQLTGGITNMLLSCKHESEIVLIRCYGHGTNLIIDRNREFISHLILNSINLAPPIYSRFKNGLIYGFLSGKSLKPEQLFDESVYPLIAQLLGQWHKNLNYKLIEEGIEKIRSLKFRGLRRNSSFSKKKSKKKTFISNVWELLDDWINIVPVNQDLISSFNTNLEVEVREENLKEVIKDEFDWLKSELSKINSPVVACHCDLLSGNIIIPDDFEFKELDKLPEINPIKFIDYEYMLPAPRAFDIANHLMEWQGFDCNKDNIPKPTKSNPVLAKWVESYLNGDSESVDDLIDEIATFYGLPGFYWGIWAMIQSELSNIDFNYSNYGKLRLEEYWEWKKHYLK